MPKKRAAEASIITGKKYMQELPMACSNTYMPSSGASAPADERIDTGAFMMPQAMSAGSTGIMIPLISFISLAKTNGVRCND